MIPTYRTKVAVAQDYGQLLYRLYFTYYSKREKEKSATNSVLTPLQFFSDTINASKEYSKNSFFFYLKKTPQNSLNQIMFGKTPTIYI